MLHEQTQEDAGLLEQIVARDQSTLAQLYDRPCRLLFGPLSRPSTRRRDGMGDVINELGGEFDGLELALAHAASEQAPGPEVKVRLMARVRELSTAPPELPKGFSVVLDAEGGWRPHPVAGIRMKLLAFNRTRRYVTVLLDVEPGGRFPPHHHSGAEECFVISGTLSSCGRTIGAGDFLHADGDTDHGELSTDTGCRVLLVVPPEDYWPGFADPSPASA